MPKLLLLKNCFVITCALSVVTLGSLTDIADGQTLPRRAASTPMDAVVDDPFQEQAHQPSPRTIITLEYTDPDPLAREKKEQSSTSTDAEIPEESLLGGAAGALENALNEAFADKGSASSDEGSEEENADQEDKVVYTVHLVPTVSKLEGSDRQLVFDVDVEKIDRNIGDRVRPAVARDVQREFGTTEQELRFSLRQELLPDEVSRILTQSEISHPIVGENEREPFDHQELLSRPSNMLRLSYVPLDPRPEIHFVSLDGSGQATVMDEVIYEQPFWIEARYDTEPRREPSTISVDIGGDGSVSFSVTKVSFADPIWRTRAIIIPSPDLGNAQSEGEADPDKDETDEAETDKADDTNAADEANGDTQATAASDAEAPDSSEPSPASDDVVQGDEPSVPDLLGNNPLCSNAGDCAGLPRNGFEIDGAGTSLKDADIFDGSTDSNDEPAFLPANRTPGLPAPTPAQSNFQNTQPEATRRLQGAADDRPSRIQGGVDPNTRLTPGQRGSQARPSGNSQPQAPAGALNGTPLGDLIAEYGTASPVVLDLIRDGIQPEDQIKAKELLDAE
jgi:hypothetical protein